MDASQVLCYTLEIAGYKCIELKEGHTLSFPVPTTHSLQKTVKKTLTLNL